jgi:hypothetical protein
MRCRPVMLFVLAGLGACGEEGIAPPVSGPAPVLDLAMNGRRTGVFACSEGLTLTGVLANPGPGSVVSNGFTLDVQSLTPECSTTLARTVGVPIEVAAGTTREVLRLDLGGVCAPPAGRPGCSFRGRGEVQTTAGVIAAELTFSTAAAR